MASQEQMGCLLSQKQQVPIFTDGRYITQAHNQLDQGNFQVYNIQEEDPREWIKANLTSTASLGYYLQYFTMEDIRKYENICKLIPCLAGKKSDYRKQAVVYILLNMLVKVVRTNVKKSLKV